MTPAAKIVYFSALAIGLSVGIFFAFRWDADPLKAYYSLRPTLSEIGDLDFSYIQYRYADTDHARTALLSFAALLEKLETVSPDKEEQLNLADTYTRLALLEDSANDAQASHDYMAKAQHWYAATGAKRSSDSEAKAAMIAADERLQQMGIR